VTLYDNTNSVVTTTTTDNVGFYLFPGLPNGIYYVGFSNLPVGYVFSPADQPDGAINSDANTSSGMTPTRTLSGNTHVTDLDAGINFGNIRVGLGTLGDLVWYDMNNNGIQDVNESGVQGVTVTLYESNGVTVVNSTTTDALGNYIFTSLSANNYVVGFNNLPSGFTISPKNADNEGLNGELNSDVNSATQKTDVIALGEGEDKMSVDMGITPPANTASLGNYVWIDLNSNGLQDSNEPGVQGMGVTLYDNANNVMATTTTDVNGEYYFVGLIPGIYYVGFNNLPQGYNFTNQNSDNLGINGSQNSDADPVTGHTNTVNLLAGTTNPNLDAGIVSTTVASVGDYVWYDVNQDGLQGSNEPGLGGVLVTLYSSANTPLASTITRPGGGYIFTNLTAGTYYMGFTNIPTGMEFTQQVGVDIDNNNSNVIQATGLTPSFTLLSGTHNPTIDAGLTTPIDAGLGNFVWYDVDKDGIQDANEPGIPGAIVTLYNQAGTVIGTSVTDGSGAYGFTNLTAGQYRICVGNVLQIFNNDGHPMIAVATTSNAGGDDALDSDIDQVGSCTINYSLAAGEFNPTLDAGYTYQFVTPVILSSFEVFADKCNAFVKWSTSSEKNLSHFVVMQKEPGSSLFKQVAIVSANGNSNAEISYQYVANVSTYGNYEYQLQMVDKDGQKVSSDINSINVNCLASNNGVEWYPNPVTSQLNLKFTTEFDDDYQITVRDMTGRIVLSTNTEIRSRHQDVSLNMSSLAVGMYSVEVVGLNYQKAFKVQLAK
nr:SdrD B-like domain-containing protein [Chitinophagaceae bacterium]